MMPIKSGPVDGAAVQPGLAGGLGMIAAAGIVEERVIGTLTDREINGPARCLQLYFELMNRPGRDKFISLSKESENGGLQRGQIRFDIGMNAIKHDARPDRCILTSCVE